MGRRHRAREIALQILYQMDMTGEPVESALAAYARGRRLPADVVAFAERLVRGAGARRAEIDVLIARSAEHWRLERMPVVDRNLLRLATFELLQGADAPPAVVIDEAIELAKRFGDADSPAFVNGVLDDVRRRIEAGEAAAAARRTGPGG
jgi:N utilization substance protein B